MFYSICEALYFLKCVYKYIYYRSLLICLVNDNIIITLPVSPLLHSVYGGAPHSVKHREQRKTLPNRKRQQNAKTIKKLGKKDL